MVALSHHQLQLSLGTVFLPAGLHRSAHAEFITLQLLRSTEAQDGRGQFITSWKYSFSQVNKRTRPSNKITVVEVSNSDLDKPMEKTGSLCSVMSSLKKALLLYEDVFFCSHLEIFLSTFETMKTYRY